MFKTLLGASYNMLLVYRILFFKLHTSQLAGEDNSNPKLHLTITSDRVVTKTSNLDMEGKKTWGIC